MTLIHNKYLLNLLNQTHFVPNKFGLLGRVSVTSFIILNVCMVENSWLYVFSHPSKLNPILPASSTVNGERWMKLSGNL